MLHRLEQRYGYFLPYRFSSMRSDEFFAAIRLLAEKEEFHRALLIGAAAGTGVTESFLVGCVQSRYRPAIFCAGSSAKALARLRKSHPGLPLTDRPLAHGGPEDAFDTLVIDPSCWTQEREVTPHLVGLLRSARYVIVNDINTGLGFTIRQQLARDAGIAIAAENAELRHGYAVFHRTENSTRA